jgi:hypothetical protein
MLLLGLAASSLMLLTAAADVWLPLQWLRTMTTSAAAVAVITAVAWGERTRSVRAVPARRPLLVTFLVTALVVVPILYLGRNFPGGYATVSAAAAAFAVWAVGAWWVGR